MQAHLPGAKMDKDMQRRLAAEFVGTFWLVFGGCGSAVISAGYPQLGIGFMGVAFAFGLTVLSMAYAVGHISGGHFNPAVTLGLWSAGRCADKHVIPYVVVQVVAAVAAAGLLWLIAAGKPDWVANGFASNGYGDQSPGHYSLLACFVCEVVITAVFLIVIMGATRIGAPAGTAPIAIGLSLTLIHLISIPVTNTSVNPARSTSQALFAGGDYLKDLWLFWVAPIIGGVIGALVYKYVIGSPEDPGPVPAVDA